MKYTWVARYTDNTALHQIDPDGTKHAYSDIDRTKLQAFELWDGATRILNLSFQPGQRLIWRRRTELSPGGILEVCHIVGKQETVNGQNYQGIIGVFESDGRMEVAAKFEENHPWFYPPAPHPEEEGV